VPAALGQREHVFQRGHVDSSGQKSSP